MIRFFAAAGPLLWPTLALAVATLWLSAGYARTRQAPRAWTAACLGVATLLLAGLAVVTGFQVSVGASAGAPQAAGGLPVLLGLAESLNALVVALLACVAAALIVAYGAFRGSTAPAEG